MVFIVTMSVLVSLSDLFSGHGDSIQEIVITEQRMPIYKAVLYSMVFPVVGTAMTYIVRYANNTVRLESFDFAMGFQFIFSIVFFLIGLWQWLSHGVEFTW